MSGPLAVVDPLLEADPERQYLAAVLSSDALAPEDLAAIPLDFADERHRIVFAAILEVARQKKVVDLLAVRDELQRRDRLDAVGGMAYLSGLTDVPTEGRQARVYVPALKSETARRALEAAVSAAAEDLRTGVDAADVAANITNIVTTTFNAVGLREMKPLQPITAGDLLEMDFPPAEKLLSPIIGAKTLAMMYAPRGGGKTYLALSFGLAAASGGTVFGEDSGRPSWRAETPHPVLYVDGEMPGELLKHRVAELVAGLNLNPEDLFRIIAADLEEDGIPSLATTKGQDLIDAHVSPGSLLILDNLSTLCRGIKENEADGWEAVQSWLLSLRQRRVAVLLIHHAGRNGLARGTSKREDVLDVVLQLATPDDYDAEEGARFEINFTKSRGLTGRAVESFEALLEVRAGRATWRTRDVAEELTERMLAMKEAGRSMRQIAAEMAVDHSTVVRRIQKAEKKAKRGRS